MLLSSPPSSSLFSHFPSRRIPLQLPSLNSSFNGLRIRTAIQIRTPFPSPAKTTTEVKMAKREEELKDIRTKTTEEINEEIIDIKGELFMLRLQKSARNEFKSSEFGRMRKRVARMLTVRREREMEEGINKRLSRKLDKKWKRGIVVRPAPSLRKQQEEEKAQAAAAEADKAAT